MWILIVARVVVVSPAAVLHSRQAPILDELELRTQLLAATDPTAYIHQVLRRLRTAFAAGHVFASLLPASHLDRDRDRFRRSKPSRLNVPNDQPFWLDVNKLAQFAITCRRRCVATSSASSDRQPVPPRSGNDCPHVVARRHFNVLTVLIGMGIGPPVGVAAPLSTR